jgi:uncharacterized membrane protein YagU involved in acid resistance
MELILLNTAVTFLVLFLFSFGFSVIYCSISDSSAHIKFQGIIGQLFINAIAIEAILSACFFLAWILLEIWN